MSVNINYVDKTFTLESSYVALSAMIYAGFEPVSNCFEVKPTGYLNPFDLNIFRKRVADNPGLISETEHVLSMWGTISDRYYKQVQNAMIENIAASHKHYQDLLHSMAFETTHIMNGFLPLATVDTKSFYIEPRKHSYLNKLESLLFHPQYEVREIAETMWKLIYQTDPSHFSSLQDPLLGLSSKYLEDSKMSSNYYYSSKALSGIGHRKTTEDILNIAESNRFEMSQEKAGYLFYDFKNFDMLRMYSVLKKNDLIWILEERPQGVQLPAWLSEFGTISVHCVLDFASVLELQQRGIVFQTPLINFKDITIHPWYILKIEKLLSNTPSPDKEKTVAEKFKDDLNMQMERIIDLTEHSPVQNAISWMAYSQYLMPLGAMCLCAIRCTLPEITSLTEDLSAGVDNPILRSIALNTCEFLSKNFNSFTTYPILKSDELTVDTPQVYAQDKRVG